MSQTVKAGLTPKRTREHHEYIGMLRRMIRAGGRRIGDADEVDLQDFLTLRHALEEAIAEAVKGQRRAGHSWAYIGRGLGVTKQAAQMRYGYADNG